MENHKREETFNVDDFAWELANSLYEDFHPFLQSSFKTAVGPLIKGRNLKELREMKLDFNVTPYELKTSYQLLDLFKKFRFSPDVYTPADVEKMTIEKFVVNQQRLAAHETVETPMIKDVLDRARVHMDRLLGDFDHLAVMRAATFGKKSSVGIPKRHACEGARWDNPISGSVDHIIWFDKLYSSFNRPGYSYAQARARHLGGERYSTVTQLVATLVLKTWKAFRIIVPNTTIGTLYTGGLGKTMEALYRDAGHDIRTLTVLHGQLARQGSIDGRTVTADQRDASDNITVWLVDRLCSVRWADALKLGRISRVEIGGQVLDVQTFCTMGIGFTFPFQCLVFYSLLCAVRDHLGLGKDTVISVFGDDMIYDATLHSVVVEAFTAIGLVINEDKTYATGRFRESCGQDFFAGQDVRPYHLAESPGNTAHRRVIEAYLYKAINGLRRRWSNAEIPATLELITGRLGLLKQGRPLFIVPSDYPDTAGVRSPVLDLYDSVNFERVWHTRNGSIQFDSLAFKADRQVENRSAPYYFKTLSANRSVNQLAEFALKKVTPHLSREVRQLMRPSQRTGLVMEEPVALLEWIDPPTEEHAITRGRDGRSVKTKPTRATQVTSIPKQDAGRYQVVRSTSVNWRPS